MNKIILLSCLCYLSYAAAISLFAGTDNGVPPDVQHCLSYETVGLEKKCTDPNYAKWHLKDVEQHMTNLTEHDIHNLCCFYWNGLDCFDKEILTQVL